MLTNEKLQEITELAQKANYKPDDGLLAEYLATVCDSEAIEEMAKEILSLRAVLDGLPPEAIAGGWTAKGISAYAKRLEGELDELKRGTEDKPEICDMCGHYAYSDDSGAYECEQGHTFWVNRSIPGKGE